MSWNSHLCFFGIPASFWVSCGPNQEWNAKLRSYTYDYLTDWTKMKLVRTTQENSGSGVSVHIVCGGTSRSYNLYECRSSHEFTSHATTALAQVNAEWLFLHSNVFFSFNEHKDILHDIFPTWNSCQNPCWDPLPYLIYAQRQCFSDSSSSLVLWSTESPRAVRNIKDHRSVLEKSTPQWPKWVQ